MNSNFLKFDYSNYRITRIVCFLVFIIFSISSCTRVTPTGGVILSGAAVQKKKAPTITTFTSEARLKEIGAEQHEDLLRTLVLYEDEALLSYVRSVGSRVAKVSEKPDLGFQFFIIDDVGINAFAAPGGYIYITRGILTYLNTEAQLAALLGHEIGHVAARHHGRQGNRNALGRGAATAVGVVTGVVTGSNSAAYQLADLSSLWARAASAGFGRELELEADGLSAAYLLDSGYDPQAMFEVLTILKDSENFARTLGGGGSYHGSFASHPRTDRRLQEIIAEVGISENQDNQMNNEMFREHLDGLIIGASRASNSKDERNRYYQTLLEYTLVFPEEWEINATTTTVTASMPNKGSIKIQAQRIQENIEPRIFIRDKMGVANLRISEPLNQYGLLGHTGTAVSTETGNIERVAAILDPPRVYTFRSEILDSASADEIDALLLSSIRTFRKIEGGEVSTSSELKIKFVQASEYFDFGIVANSSPLTNNAEEYLRLLNGYYPRGTPEAGEWVKLVE